MNCVLTVKVFVCLLSQRYGCLPTPSDVVLYKYFPVIDKKNRLKYQYFVPGFYKINSTEMMTEVILIVL